VSRRSAAVAVAAAYAALAGLVAAGALSGVDQRASDHLMPGAGAPGSTQGFLESLVPFFHYDLANAVDWADALVALPGQVVLSFLLIAAVGEALRRRGRVEAGAAWLAAWALGTAVEVVCKETLVRPALYRHGVHVVGFDSSWPSGHTLRCALVAAAIGTLWPRARPLLALWVAACVALLVAAGDHTPSDVAGGLLLAALLALGVRELERSGLLRRRAALRARRARAAAGRRA
jgi:membrane-associated phospholipid phosphatase